MKKILMTLAAVLCCWVTITVFTACGDDDDNTPRADDTKPAKIAMVFHFLNTSIGVVLTGMDKETKKQA